MKFDLVQLMIGGFLFLILSVLLNRKFKLCEKWVLSIKKAAPLFLVFFPPLITYFIICDTLSLITVELYQFLIGGLEQFDPVNFIRLEKAVEYFCSFFIPIVYFNFLYKNGFPSFWTIIITISHVLVAGYRDPILLFDPANTTYRETGAQLLEQIQYFDASIPLFAFLFFYFVLRKYF